MKPPHIVTLLSPAKINLFLAVTGRRPDGYHELVSVVAPLAFGDQLVAEVEGRGSQSEGRPSLVCDDPEVPCDESNLILKAARLFGEAAGWKRAVAFRLTKRIPMGAGLGGGSSNAAAALLALNELSDAGLSRDALAALAAQVGSDCPLFLSGGPVIMRGRGERVEPLPVAAARRLRGRPVLLFKPNFSIRTEWAYERMAAAGSYEQTAGTERRLAAWIESGVDPAELLHNGFEAVVFRKFLALPALLDCLRTRFGLAAGLSGSGSACFALLTETAPVAEIVASVREAWGPYCFVESTAIA